MLEINSEVDAECLKWDVAELTGRDHITRRVLQKEKSPQKKSSIISACLSIKGVAVYSGLGAMSDLLDRKSTRLNSSH